MTLLLDCSAWCACRYTLHSQASTPASQRQVSWQNAAEARACGSPLQFRKPASPRRVRASVRTSALRSTFAFNHADLQRACVGVAWCGSAVGAVATCVLMLRIGVVRCSCGVALVVWCVVWYGVVSCDAPRNCANLRKSGADATQRARTQHTRPSLLVGAVEAGSQQLLTPQKAGQYRADSLPRPHAGSPVGNSVDDRVPDPHVFLHAIYRKLLSAPGLP